MVLLSNVPIALVGCRFLWNNPRMDIGSRLRGFREHKKLTQSDIERRTGLLRYYISRVENGHLTPSIETLEKFARALEVPLYQLFYDAATPQPSESETTNPLAWSESRKVRRFAQRFHRLLGQLSERDRNLLLSLARWMSQRKLR